MTRYLVLARRLQRIFSRGQYNVCSAFIGFVYECSVAALDSSVGPSLPDGIRTETITRVRPDETSERVRLPFAAYCCLCVRAAWPGVFQLVLVGML